MKITKILIKLNFQGISDIPVYLGCPKMFMCEAIRFTIKYHKIYIYANALFQSEQSVTYMGK